MSSQVLYHPTPTTPSRNPNNSSNTVTIPTKKRGRPSAGNSIIAPAQVATTSATNTSSIARPRRAAALASEAAIQATVTGNGRRGKLTGSSSKSSYSSTPSTLPHTPSTFTDSFESERKMAALPRAKRARRNEPDTLTYNVNGGSMHSIKGGGGGGTTAMYAPGSSSTTTINALQAANVPSSKNSLLMGMNSALAEHGSRAYLNVDRSVASSSKSWGSNIGGSSIREMIGGQEREVFVVDSASPPPASYGQGHLDSSYSVKGKRKAPETGNATSSVLSTTSATAKRRRKDPTDVSSSGSIRKANIGSGLYAGNGAVDPYNGLRADDHTSGTNALVSGSLSNYRGGYNAGNSYLKTAQQKNGAYAPVDHTYAHPSSTSQSKLPTDDSEGHFIVREGEYVTERYRISSLLGQGTFGKVVRCKDMYGSGEVAIKIIRAIQKYTDAAQIEIRVLRTLRDHDPTNKNKCIHLLDTFTYRNHVCIVSELLGQSVYDFLKDNDFRPFPPRHIWHFAKQLLKSVAFLHNLGLVHTDLKPENILLVNSEYNTVPISWRPNSRKTRILRDCDIRLIDFGSATFNDEYHSQVVSTRHYRAPEIILQMGWSFPCDAWSIGCILIEFYTGEALFQTHDNLEHLAMMEAVLGPMPDDFRRKAETYKPNYFKAGKLDFPNSSTNRQSKKYVKAMRNLDNTMLSSQQDYLEHDFHFKHLLKSLLTFDPSKRLRVDDALRHPYFGLRNDQIPP